MYTRDKTRSCRVVVAALTSAQRQAGFWHRPAAVRADALAPCGSEPAATPHHRVRLAWAAAAAAALFPGQAASPAGTAVLPGAGWETCAVPLT